LIRWRS